MAFPKLGPIQFPIIPIRHSNELVILFPISLALGRDYVGVGFNVQFDEVGLVIQGGRCAVQDYFGARAVCGRDLVFLSVRGMLRVAGYCLPACFFVVLVLDGNRLLNILVGVNRLSLILYLRSIPNNFVRIFIHGLIHLRLYPLSLIDHRVL